MPVPYLPPSVERYTRIPSHHHLCSAVGAQITSLKSDDLIVPRLPACGREWWKRLVSPSTGGDWWATCHNESCARNSRLQYGIKVSPLLPHPFTYGESIHLGQQLRTLCLEIELEKRRRGGGVFFLLNSHNGGFLFPFFFFPRRGLIRVRVKDGRGEAEVSQWTLGWGGRGVTQGAFPHPSCDGNVCVPLFH